MRPTLIAVLVLTLAAASYGQPLNQTADGFYFRVILPAATDRNLSMHGEILPTRKKPIKLERVTLNRDEATGLFTTPWIRVVPISAKAGGMIDHAVVFVLTDENGPLEEMHLTVELVGGEPAEHLPDPNARLALTQHTLGSTNTFLVPTGDPALTWRDARWLSDHIDHLDEQLNLAGYTEPIKINGISYEAELNLRRFGPPMLTEDPRQIAILGDILARVGFNRSNRTGYNANPDHFDGYLSRMHLSGAHPVYAPMDESVKAQLPAFWREYENRYQPGGEFEGQPKPTILKLGDEISRLRDTDELRNSPHFNQLVLEQAKIVTGDDPKRLGLTSWNQLEVPQVLTRDPEMRSPQDVPEGQRLLMYIVLRAANVATIEMYAENTAAVHEYVDPSIRTTVNLLGVLYGGGYSRLAWWHMTPDYFRMADQHGVDLLQVQAAVPFYPPSGPLTMSLLMPGLAKLAADRNPDVEAEVMHFGARVEPAAYQHIFMSTLGSGVDHITTYRFGLKATGWEWYDAPSKVNAFARMGRMLEALSPFVVGAEQHDAEIAVLHAESSDLWDHRADSRSKAGVRGPWFAMRFTGRPMDTVREYMVEAGELAKYDLLFVGQRNVNRKVQRAILRWVRDGGTLVLLPGAMAFDGGDQPTAMVSDALAPAIDWPGVTEPPRHYIEFEKAATVAQVNWPGVGEVDAKLYALPVEGAAQVVATYADGSAAARQTALGEGQVIAMGFSPSISTFSDAAKSKAAWQELTVRDDAVDESVIGATREGAPYWLEADSQGLVLFEKLTQDAEVEPKVTASVENVDAQVLWHEDRAMVTLSNYNLEPVGEIEVLAKLPRRFAHVRTMTGQPVEVERLDDGWVRLATKLDNSDAILFADDPGFFGLGDDVPVGFAQGKPQVRHDTQGRIIAMGLTAVEVHEQSRPAATDTPWLFAEGVWQLGPEVRLKSGEAGDIPVVADFDGDGFDEIALVRNQNGTLVWYVSGTAAGFEDDPISGFEKRRFRHGDPGDVPVSGDWNGDGKATPGLIRDAIGTWRWLLTNQLAAGVDVDFRHGTVATDVPVVGDWNDDGSDSVGLVRDEDGLWRWLLTNRLGPGIEALDRRFGETATDLPVAGRWSVNSGDSIGLYRQPVGQWFLADQLTDTVTEPTMQAALPNANHAGGITLPADP